MLDQSVAELKMTVDELEKRYNNVNDEGKFFSDRPTVPDCFLMLTNNRLTC